MKYTSDLLNISSNIIKLRNLKFYTLQNGEIKLTYHIYKLSFMNFLLGKQPNGPGQYIFGTVQPKAPTCMFPIDYSAMNATEEDMEPFRYKIINSN